MKGRIIFSVLLVVGGLIVPWWISLIFFVLASYLYAPWFEGIGIGLFFDLVFGMQKTSFHGFEGVYTAIIVLSIATMYFIKKRFINV